MSFDCACGVNHRDKKYMLFHSKTTISIVRKWIERHPEYQPKTKEARRSMTQPDFRDIACRVAFLVISEVQNGHKTIKTKKLEEYLDGLDHWLFTKDGKKDMDRMDNQAWSTMMDYRKALLATLTQESQSNG